MMTSITITRGQRAKIFTKCKALRFLLQNWNMCRKPAASASLLCKELGNY